MSDPAVAGSRFLAHLVLKAAHTIPVLLFVVKQVDIAKISIQVHIERIIRTILRGTREECVKI